MSIEAYNIAANMVVDAEKAVGPIMQIIQAYERLQKSQDQTQMKLNEMVSALSGARRMARGLASDFSDLASAAKRASDATSRFNKVGGGSGGRGSSAGGSSGGSSRSERNTGRNQLYLPAPDEMPSRDLVFIPGQGNSRGNGANFREGMRDWRYEPNFTFPDSGYNGDRSLPSTERGFAPIKVGPVPLVDGKPAPQAERGNMPRHGLNELGFYSVAAGTGIEHLVGSALGQGMTTDDLLHVLQADTRITNAQAKSAYNAAFAATNSAQGTRINTNLEALIDLKNVTGSLGEAQDALPAFAKMTARLQTLDRQRGGQGDEAYAAAKAMDIMGGMIDETVDPKTGRTSRSINPALLQHRLDLMTRVAVATNDRVDPRQYLGFAKQARVAGMTLSDEFIYEKLPALIQTMGGSRAGTAMMSIAQVFKGGMMTDKTYDALAAIGLASPDTVQRVRDPKTHRLHKVRKPGQIFDADLLGHDPLEWMQHAQERMEKAGIHGTEAQITALMKASQRSTIAGMFADILKDMPAILRDQQNIRATDISKMDTSAAAHINDLTAAWNRFMTVTGNSNTQTAISAMDAITNGLNAISEAERKHPNAAHDLTLLAAGIGAVGAAAGAALLTIGPILGVKALSKYIKGPVVEGAEKASPSLLGRGISTAADIGVAGLRRVPLGALIYTLLENLKPGTTTEHESDIVARLNREHATQSGRPIQVNLQIGGQQVASVLVPHIEAKMTSNARKESRASNGMYDSWAGVTLPGVSGGR